jgi:hypothetical protein
MKNSSNTIGNRTCGLPACTAVSQPTAPPAACVIVYKGFEEILFPKQAPVGGTVDASTLRAGHPRSRCPFPANYKRSILSQGVTTDVGALPPSYSMGTVSCSYGDSGRGVYLTTNLNVVPRLGMYGAAPPCLICLQGVHRDAFT